MDRRQIVVALLVFTYGCVAYKLVKTDSGLKIGEARRKIGCEIGAKHGSLISVHYTGYFMNGTKFDSSLDSNAPFRLILGVCPGTRENPSEAGIIQGWAEGVRGMCVGERRKLIIPPHLGYGEEGKGDKIPGNSTLHFDVELVNLINEASAKKLQEIVEIYNCTKIVEHSNNEIEAKLFLSRYDAELQKLNTISTIAAWNYYTNLTEENEKINNAASLKVKPTMFYL